MIEQHDIEIITNEEAPVADQHVLKAVIETCWAYERNPRDKEVPHYHGEDDGYYLEDWTLLNAELDGKELAPGELSKEHYALIEREVGNLEPDV